MNGQFPLLDKFAEFITERWNIHLQRKAGKPAPWTADPILLKYKFTNTRREDDRVSRWVHTNWLKPHQYDLDTVVFAMALARTVNLPAMLEVLGYPHQWNCTRFVKLMEQRRAKGERTFSGAYLIHAVRATRGQSKASYLGAGVFTPLWKARKRLGAVIRDGCTLRELHGELLQFNGFGTFMSAQIIADLKWTPALRKAKDWDTFAASGPGSRRGLDRLRGVNVVASKSNFKGGEEEWVSTLLDLRAATLTLLPKELKRLDAQNFNSACCEFDKYCRVYFNEGSRPKQLFRQSKEPY